MRRGMFIAGLVVLVLGILLVVVGLVVQSGSQTQYVPGGSALSLTPNSVGSASLSLSWSGGSSSTEIYVATGTLACPPGGVVAQGQGASGSISATLSSGTTYYVLACTSSGAGASVDVSYTTSSFSILMLIGVIIAVLGAVVAVLGVRLKPRVRPVVSVSREPVSEVPAYTMPTPIGPDSQYSQPVPPVGVRPETPPPPARFMPASEPVPNSQTSPPPGGVRENVVCASCGTVNEPWITNCRKCRRPLSHTGG